MPNQVLALFVSFDSVSTYFVRAKFYGPGRLLWVKQSIEIERRAGTWLNLRRADRSRQLLKLQSIEQHWLLDFQSLVIAGTDRFSRNYPTKAPFRREVTLRGAQKK